MMALGQAVAVGPRTPFLHEPAPVAIMNLDRSHSVPQPKLSTPLGEAFRPVINCGSAWWYWIYT